MTSRREFVRLSALAVGSVVVFPKSGLGAAYTERMNYGVQLYMVRRQAPADLAGVLKGIRAIGFKQIELYPIVYSHPADELKKIVEDAGLGLVSAHFDYVGFADKVEYGRKLGLRYMVCPMLPETQWSSLAGFSQAAKDFNAWGKAVKDAGMTFAFHNHCYEFKPQGGSSGWETLMHETDASVVKLELDMYWLTQAGQDPNAMLKRYADRARLIHLKDRLAGAPAGYEMGKVAEHFTELGRGTIDWPGILAQAKQQGISYAYLDQDETAGPVMDSMRKSFAYLQRLGE